MATFNVENLLGLQYAAEWRIRGFVNIDEHNSSGLDATVYLAENTNSGKRAALKVMKPSVAQAVFERKTRLMQYIRDVVVEKSTPKLTSLARLLRTTGPNPECSTEAWSMGGYRNKVLALEALQGQELLDHINMDQNFRSAGEDRVRVTIYDVLRGMRELHAHGIVHLDVKPENLRFRDVENKELVLIDLDGCIAKSPQDSWPFRSTGGNTTEAYRAPELQREGTGYRYYNSHVLT
jgi:serine/threonine protein kinase